MYVYQVILVQIFYSQVSVATTREIYPLEDRPHICGWHIQIDALFRLRIHESVSQ